MSSARRAETSSTWQRTREGDEENREWRTSGSACERRAHARLEKDAPPDDSPPPPSRQPLASPFSHAAVRRPPLRPDPVRPLRRARRGGTTSRRPCLCRVRGRGRLPTERERGGQSRTRQALRSVRSEGVGLERSGSGKLTHALQACNGSVRLSDTLQRDDHEQTGVSGREVGRLDSPHDAPR